VALRLALTWGFPTSPLSADFQVFPGSSGSCWDEICKPIGLMMNGWAA
jgi:hypothetical protein